MGTSLKTLDLNYKGQRGFEKFGTAVASRGQTVNDLEWECFRFSFVINEWSLEATSKVRRPSNLLLDLPLSLESHEQIKEAK